MFSLSMTASDHVSLVGRPSFRHPSPPFLGKTEEIRSHGISTMRRPIAPGLCLCACVYTRRVDLEPFFLWWGMKPRFLNLLPGFAASYHVRCTSARPDYIVSAGKHGSPRSGGVPSAPPRRRGLPSVGSLRSLRPGCVPPSKSAWKTKRILRRCNPAGHAPNTRRLYIKNPVCLEAPHNRPNLSLPENSTSQIFVRLFEVIRNVYYRQS